MFVPQILGGYADTDIVATVLLHLHLVNVVHHMRKADLLSAQEAGLIQEMGLLKDKVHLLVEFLSVTDPHGAALQTYLKSSHLTEYNLITVHG